MSRTVKYLFTALVVSAMLSGCFEGPVGPQGDQGTQGEKGEQGEHGPRGPAGEGIVEHKTFILTSQNMEVEYSTILGYIYTIELHDDWFEAGCGYVIEQTNIYGSSWFVTGGVLNQFGIDDGYCFYGFTIPLKTMDVGCSLTFYKIKP